MSYTYAQKKRQPAGHTDEAASAGPEIAFSNSARLDALRSGTSMPTAQEKGRRIGFRDAMRAKMENAFGMDFSGVKLYESQAVEDAGAEAVAQGNEIAFAPGRADFSGASGQKLLGHELSHVALQSRGAVTGSGFLADSALEDRADREGAMAARGGVVGGGMYAGAAAPMSAATAAPTAGPMQAEKPKKDKKKDKKKDIKKANKKGSKSSQNNKKKVPMFADNALFSPDDPIETEDVVDKDFDMDMLAGNANNYDMLNDKELEAHYNDLKSLANFALNNGGMTDLQKNIRSLYSDKQLQQNYGSHMGMAKAYRDLFKQQAEGQNKEYGGKYAKEYGGKMGNQMLLDQLKFVTELESRRRKLSKDPNTPLAGGYKEAFGKFVKDQSLFGEQPKPVQKKEPQIEVMNLKRNPVKPSEPIPYQPGPKTVAKGASGTAIEQEKLADREYKLDDLSKQAYDYEDMKAPEAKQAYYENLRHLVNFSLNHGGMKQSAKEFNWRKTDADLEKTYPEQVGMAKALRDYHKMPNRSDVEDPYVKSGYEKLQEHMKYIELMERKRRNLDYREDPKSEQFFNKLFGDFQKKKE